MKKAIDIFVRVVLEFIRLMYVILLYYSSNLYVSIYYSYVIRNVVLVTLHTKISYAEIMPSKFEPTHLPISHVIRSTGRGCHLNDVLLVPVDILAKYPRNSVSDVCSS